MEQKRERGKGCSPAQRGLHARDTLVGHACKAETSESAEMRKSGIESKRRTLHKTDVKSHFVPFDDRARDLEEGQADRSLCAQEAMRQVSACGQRRFERPPLTPRLRGLEDEVVERVAD